MSYIVEKHPCSEDSIYPEDGVYGLLVLSHAWLRLGYKDKAWQVCQRARLRAESIPDTFARLCNLLEISVTMCRIEMYDEAQHLMEQVAGLARHFASESGKGGSLTSVLKYRGQAVASELARKGQLRKAICILQQSATVGEDLAGGLLLIARQRAAAGAKGDARRILLSVREESVPPNLLGELARALADAGEVNRATLSASHVPDVHERVLTMMAVGGIRARSQRLPQVVKWSDSLVDPAEKVFAKIGIGAALRAPEVLEIPSTFVQPCELP